MEPYNTVLQVVPGKPLYEEDRGWRMWHKPEVWTGPNGKGVWVPNVGDLIFDPLTGFEIVTDLDLSTYLTKTKPWTPPKRPEELDNLDLLQGTGPGRLDESWRCYIDTSVLPHTMVVDRRLYFFAQDAAYAKIFAGPNVQGRCISKIFDTSMALVSENIPLELVAVPDTANYAIKTLAPAYTTERLPDNDVVCVGVYNAEGGLISEARLLVRNTAFVRTIEANQKYITSIQILSPFLAPADPLVIEFPINVTLGSVTMLGQVNYSDGSHKVIPVDGSKLALHGLERYVSTIEGQEVPLVLSYALAPNEYSYDNTAYGKFITQSYRARTRPVDGAYSVKLFAYPCWDPNRLAYELHWYLYNLLRQTWYRVDNLVELGVSSPPFNPQLFGQTQVLTYAIDLSKVDGRFAKYRHVQKLEVALLAPGSEERTLWQITHDPLYDFPYGVEVYCTLEHISGGNYQAKLNEAYTNFDLWLERFFYGTFPLTNTRLEARPPKPTHMVVDANGVNIELPISSWNKPFIIPTEVRQGQNVYIHWIKRDDTTDQHLGVSGVSIRHK